MNMLESNTNIIITKINTKKCNILWKYIFSVKLIFIITFY